MAGKGNLSNNTSALSLSDIIKSASTPGDSQDALRDQLQQEYAQVVVQDCGTLLRNESTATNVSRYAVLGIAVLGTVAGSIVVPALTAKAVIAKSTIAAWGGVAGAANALQATVGQVGLSPQAQSDTRQAVVNSLLTEAKDYADGWKTFPKNIDDQISALENMRVICDIHSEPGASALTAPSK